jgi:hypothetical protein
MYRIDGISASVVSTLLLTVAAFGQAQPASQPAVAGIPPEARYACPMESHPGETDPARQGAYFSAEPGDCPWCGMQLKPLAELSWVQAPREAQGAEVAYTCPDHQHVFSKTPAECPRCGTKLQPFKVVYTCPAPQHADVIAIRPGSCPRCGRTLAPYRGVWLAPEMAARNVPPHPEVAADAAYRCRVHPLVHSDRPGQCPICARALEPAGEVAGARGLGPSTASSATKYVCPMHLAQTSAERGTCPVCGMQLVPAKDVPRPTSAPAAIATQVDFLMEHYLELQRRFASDSLKEVPLHALGLVGASDDLLGLTDDPAVTLPADFTDAVRTLRVAALRLSGKDLDADRVTFVELGGAMRRIIEHVRPNKTQFPRLYIFHCPMTKGDWIQTTDDMANPFYGFKMLKCGEPRAIK